MPRRHPHAKRKRRRRNTARVRRVPLSGLRRSQS